MVADAYMFDTYYRPCRIESAIGFSDKSLMGCLLARPLALPAFVAKKWVGLFDYFRFTPYMENLTPPWLRTLSRAYGALAWVGLSLCIATLLTMYKQSVRANVRTLLVAHAGVVLLAAYTLVMLAQHTALHTEERYGFPLIPICAVQLLRAGNCKVPLRRRAHCPILASVLRACSSFLFCADFCLGSSVTSGLTTVVSQCRNSSALK